MKRNNCVLKSRLCIARLMAAWDHQRRSNSVGDWPPDRRAKSSPIRRTEDSRSEATVTGAAMVNGDGEGIDFSIHLITRMHSRPLKNFLIKVRYLGTLASHNF